MPAKKAVATEETAATPKKRTCKRKTTTAAAESATDTTETVAKKTTAKKTATKKTTTAKKTTTKKTAAKKVEEPAKVEAPVVEETVKVEEPVVEVAKRTVKDYEDIINWKKGEAHAMDWLYIEVNAGDLLTEVEAGVDNLAATCQAILNVMLEGDGFIVRPTEEDMVSTSLTVRYYCDNLSADRRKYFEN